MVRADASPVQLDLLHVRLAAPDVLGEDDPGVAVIPVAALGVT